MNEFDQMMRRWRNRFERWMAEQKGSRSSGGDQRPQHKMCPVCGKFNDKNATICEYCDATLRPGGRSDFDSKGRLRGAGINPIYVIFAVCAFAHLIGILISTRDGVGLFSAPSSRALVVLGGNFSEYVFERGEIWRLVTHAYLHGGMMHILFNMMALGNLGPLLLESFGARRFWLITLLTAIAGGAASAIGGQIGIGGLSIGFSGALFGYLGAGYIALSRSGHLSLAHRFKNYMIWGNVIFIALSFLGIWPVDNLAHLGGMFAGLGLGRLLLSEGWARHGQMAERILLVLCLLLLAYGVYESALYLNDNYLRGAP